MDSEWWVYFWIRHCVMLHTTLIFSPVNQHRRSKFLKINLESMNQYIIRARLTALHYFDAGDKYWLRLGVGLYCFGRIVVPNLFVCH